MKFVFTRYAERQWKKLTPAQQESIREKLKFLAAPETFAKNAKKVVEIQPATHRLRVGNYRLLLLCEGSQKEYLVLKIGHRRDIYR